MQALNDSDYALIMNYVNTILERFTSREIHLNANINRQNWRFLIENNPKLLHQQPLRSPKLTAWIEMSVNCIISPYFFDDHRGKPITVNLARYILLKFNL